MDAEHPHERETKSAPELEKEQRAVAPETAPKGDNWHPGDAPSQALRWSLAAAAKAATLSIIGVYAPTMESFPIGEAMMKNLRIHMGNCNHRRYIPDLVRMVQSGELRPLEVLTVKTGVENAISADQSFDQRSEGWLKVALEA